MPQLRTAEEIQSEILLIQTTCFPPPNKERIVQELLKEYSVVSRFELKQALETLPFIIACLECDTDSPENYQQAVAEGWQEIVPDDGPGWHFLGVCPACAEKERNLSAEKSP